MYPYIVSRVIRLHPAAENQLDVFDRCVYGIFVGKKLAQGAQSE
jgi:hypothetical protein